MPCRAMGPGNRAIWLTRLVAVSCALTLAACSEPASPETPDSVQLKQAQVEAREYGVSDAQLEILERAGARGEVTLSDVREAIDNTFACFDEQKIWHSSQQHTTFMGHEQLSYSYGAPPGYEDDDPTWLALAEACVASNSGVVEMLYQTLPSVALRQEQWFVDNVRDDVSECLARYGVTAPTGADSTWYWMAVTELSQPEFGGVQECDSLMVKLAFSA